MRENRLMEVRYQDSAQGIMLTGYADTVIANPQYKLIGIRFGGYPEMVQGLYLRSALDASIYSIPRYSPLRSSQSCIIEPIYSVVTMISAETTGFSM